MELAIGRTIYLNREFIGKFETDKNSKISRSFQVIAMTDLAVGLKNIRNGRTYTLSLNAVSQNMEKSPGNFLPKARVTKRTTFTPPPPVTPPPVVPPPVTPPPVTPPPAGTSDYVASIAGGVNIRRASALTSVEADDPFGGLYG